MNPTDVSVIVVSYNTRNLTLQCLRSVFEQTHELAFEMIVVDNASTDGSADAIAEEFPHARLIRSETNLGFARANNLAAHSSHGDYLLLLNPDTVVLDEAIDKLLAFARHNAKARIFGGRTLFADGTLNRSSAWARSSPWSEFCYAVGLSAVFRGTRLFDPESLGRWKRDSVRHVDIASGCFFLIERELWEHLGGFDPAFFMYGEEADLCLRARPLGARPLICPDATIVHYGGKSERRRAPKLVRLLTARRMLIERHWPRRWIGFGRTMQRLGILSRLWMSRLLCLRPGSNAADTFETYAEVWRARGTWSQQDVPTHKLSEQDAMKGISDARSA